MEPEKNGNGLHEYLFRSAPLLAAYCIRLRKNFCYSCECRYQMEYLRPYPQVLEAIDTSYKHTKLDVFNAWDFCWFDSVWRAETWLKQHAYTVKRAVVMGSVLKQEELIPADLSRKPERKRKRPHEPPHRNHSKHLACGMSGHFASSRMTPDSVADAKQDGEKGSDGKVVIYLMQG